jgi:hypothetical protein
LQQTPQDFVARVASTASWDERIEEIRRVPEVFGQVQQQTIYGAIASRLYRPHLAAQFAYVQWRDDYELPQIERAYMRAFALTDGFSKVGANELASTLRQEPATLRIFRLIIGYTSNEFSVAASEAAARIGVPAVGKARIDAIEAGSTPSDNASRTCAETIHLLMTGQMWNVATGDFRSKLEKPDTVEGWNTVREFARSGVPYHVLLHQRHYGGPFRTLLDATSSARGDSLELPLEELFTVERVPFIRTGRHNQAEIANRFNLTVRPAPDFVIFEGTRTLRAIVECKQANDGGTARDKASRFRTLANEAGRLGGVPLFAVLDGLGWQRVADALGPVVRDTDGRVFSLATLHEILELQPFPRLRGLAN